MTLEELKKHVSMNQVWTTEAVIDFIDRAYQEGLTHELTDSIVYNMGVNAERKRIMGLIEKHDPRGAEANPHYWGKTLRAAIEKGDV